MYQDFFSLNKQPFSISPDPDFIFLSERHKEALAHLTYGLQDNGGFVLLTGEVGTGKTTVCRALLQDISEETDIAYILNPALSEIELLATICDEFKIAYELNLKSLFDAIKAWMMDNLRAGRSAIVLIDEAQHLSFSSLEQLRLLTNIESNNKKPLQVILIGQTELQQKLKQTEFRQLAQRITARYHLLPLNRLESEYYIQHRLHVAGARSPLFDRNTIALIFKISQGIPRIINLLCDRSLLCAYSEHAAKVTPKMVRLAAHEIGVDGRHKSSSFLSQWGRFALLTIFVVIIMIQGAKLYSDNLFVETKKVTIEPLLATQAIQVIEVSEPPAQKTSEAKEDRHVAEDGNWFDNYPTLDLTDNEFADALVTLYALWGYQTEAQTVNCELGGSILLSCFSEYMSLEQVKQANYPAIIKLENEDQYAYVVLYKVNDNYQLLIADQVINVSASWLSKYWQGEVTLLWQAPFILESALQFGQKNAKVAWLSSQLNSIAGLPTQNKDRFDLSLLQQVVDFQREQGLEDDGIVGSNTDGINAIKSSRFT
ncbi:AAA family ATPase [Psychromonas sp. MME2]|uniref:AAA family ATPase n=1 Tax=Psychromonas sp. MME2 TaxID=3231033 RepID=UPI00339CA2FC